MYCSSCLILLSEGEYLREESSCVPVGVSTSSEKSLLFDYSIYDNSGNPIICCVFYLFCVPLSLLIVHCICFYSNLFGFCLYFNRELKSLLKRSLRNRESKWFLKRSLVHLYGLWVLQNYCNCLCVICFVSFYWFDLICNLNTSYNLNLCSLDCTETEWHYKPIRK